MILLYHTDIIIVDFISGALKKNLVFLRISECTYMPTTRSHGNIGKEIDPNPFGRFRFTDFRIY